MRVFFGCFSIIPVITWILLYRKQRELMDPVNIYTLIYMINTMLPIILFSLDSGNAAIGNRYLRCAVENDSLFIKYVLLQVFAYYLVVGGMHINIPIKLHMKDRVSYYLAVCQDDGNKKYVIWGCLFWIVGFFAFFMIMRQVGGIYYFFTNLQHRTTLMRNIDFWSWLLTLMNYACLFFVYALKGTSKKPRIPLIVILCISGIMVGLGGRKALLMLLLEAIIVYHYSVKRFALKDLFKIKYIFALVGIYIFFILIRSFRQAGAIEAFASDPMVYLQDANMGLGQMIMSESYVPFYIAILQYFNTHDFWFGKSFVGLITAIIPSSLYASKPPVDDGTYLYSICLGRNDIVPPMPFKNLNGSSYPLETFGSMYANFGVIGLFLGMLLLGIIIGMLYKNMADKGFSLFSIVIYAEAILTFQLSTLRIFQFVGTLISFTIILFIVNYIKVGKRRSFEKNKTRG